MKPKKLPSAKYLHECFTYSKKTGVLTWKQRPRNHFPNTNAWAVTNAKYAGKPAGGVQGRYLTVRLFGLPHQAARVIWKMVTGKEPVSTIDHENGRKLDNRWANLREASYAQQNANWPKFKNNTSGVRGVDKVRNGWRVRIAFNGVRQSLGTFSTLGEAVSAYSAAARKTFGRFANL